MSWITGLKERAGRFSLEREFKKLNRKVSAIGMESAKDIGIIYDATDKKNFELVKQYSRFLKEESKKVKAIGFLDIKREPEGILRGQNLEFYTRKDLNWYYKPIGNTINEFVNHKFDILIDLSVNENLALTYAIGLSKAKFKVGRMDETTRKYCDLMINLGERKDLKYFIDQINHYLQLIHSKNGR